MDLDAPALRSLLDGPSPATVTVYGENGQVITSPVWFRATADAFEFVVAAEDHRVAHIQRDPRCTLLNFEAVRPFRGVQVRGDATLRPDDGAKTRLDIASRYLGGDAGRAHADVGRRPPGFVVRLPIAGARAWDLADKLP